MDSKIIKAFIGLIAAFILVIAVFGILPQLGMKGPFENFQNPLAGLFEGGKNAAANAALDVSGLKSKAESALRGNTDRIAEATGMSSSQVDAAIDALDIQSWEVTNLPEGAEKTGSANISYSGTDATITTYDDPSVFVTVTAMGQDITLAVPDNLAQSYLPFLSHSGTAWDPPPAPRATTSRGPGKVDWAAQKSGPRDHPGYPSKGSSADLGCFSSVGTFSLISYGNDSRKAIRRPLSCHFSFYREYLIIGFQRHLTSV